MKNRLIDNLELMKEYDFNKNSNVNLEKITLGSHKKIWWRCKNEHEWEISVKDRSNGYNCPYCSNQKLLRGYNDLETINPELAQEWNYEKNGSLKPDQVMAGSEKKVWWRCALGHEWPALIYNRNKGVGCPYCSNRLVLVGYNDLATVNPKVAKEWNYEKNGDLRPTDVLAGSHKKVWWICSRGHEWRIDIKTRNSGNNCPYCSNKKVLAGYNDLFTVYPEIAAEWSKQNSLSPHEVIRGGNTKFFWVCPMGHEDYQSSIDQRIRGQGCPKCAQQSQTSFPEQAIYFYVRQLFPDAINRYQIQNTEIDIYIPSKHIGIEYNGYFAHKEKSEKDFGKKEKLQSLGIQLIQIKEYKKVTECYNADFYIHERTTGKSLSNLIVSILSQLAPSNTVSVDCGRDQALIDGQYIDAIKKNSIASAMPKIISEWDYKMNGDIKPEFISRNSKYKYFWNCPICGYSYFAAPTMRLRGSSCPACAGKTVHSGFNDLKTKRPEIAAEWAYEKNGSLKPTDVFYRSTDIVWWKCNKGHYWEKSIFSRTKNKSNCPYCSGRQVITGFNDLQTQRPDIAEEWDFELNDVTPDKVHYNNQTIQAHWICKQCGHKWKHTVSNRGRCPECLRLKAQINVYKSDDLSLYGHFENAKLFCEYIGIDYYKNQRSISNACRRVHKTFMGKYILRYRIDDEFAGDQ